MYGHDFNHHDIILLGITRSSPGPFAGGRTYAGAAAPQERSEARAHILNRRWWRG